MNRLAYQLIALLALAVAAAAPLVRGAQEPKAEPARGSAAAKAEPRDFAGRYLADGVGNGGRPYRAMVEITRQGETYVVAWVLGPREAYVGVGITEGRALCVGWSSNDTPGVVVYQPEGDRLVGRWAAPNDEGRTFKETLTPVKP